MPSEQDMASVVPLWSNDTSFAGLSCSLRYSTRDMSRVFTTFTTTSLHAVSGVLLEGSSGCSYSLATAAHMPSGDRATSRTGRVLRSKTSSSSFVCKEYLHTAPSSDPAMKKSLVATIAVCVSFVTSILIGSASDPVVKTRMTLFEPTVMSFLPFGVYVQWVVPGASECCQLEGTA